MARVLFAWELGGGYGHLRRLLPIAEALAAAGHTIGIAAVDLVRTDWAAAHTAFTLLQAPPPPPPSVGVPVHGYAGMLLANGFGWARDLSRRLDLWLALLDGFAPDLLVAEFAPTALLAARLAGLRRAHVGTGYTLPPTTSPLPACRAWAPPPPGLLQAEEDAAMATIAAACRRLGRAPPDRLAGLFDGPAFLCTFPELDHYVDRGPADYHGPIYEHASGAAPDWPAGEGPRLFGYLTAGHHAFAAIVAALGRLGLPTLLHVRGVSAEAARDIAQAHPALRISLQPVHLGQALENAALVLCQGLNTTSAALAAGCPLLSCPQSLEQDMVAHQVLRRRLGGTVSLGDDAGTVLSTLARLLDDPVPRSHAVRFAAHYAGFDPGLPARAVAESLAELLI